MRYANNRPAKAGRSLNGGTLRRLFLLAGLIFGLAALGTAFASVASADTVGPITFEPPTYIVANIDGQNGWMKSGPYDVAVVATSFPTFGSQSLRLSDAFTSGSFGDQTFSPGLLTAAGESPALSSHFDSTFSFGSTSATEQSGMHMSVSPDNGTGGRMSYLRFEDQFDGVHVFFDDATDPSFGTTANFNETQIAILDRTIAHTIRFSIDFKAGPANDVVKIYIDGALKITGTTWEDYYRYDPEQVGGGNLVPTTQRMLFRESGAAHLSNAGNGFLVDGLSLSSLTKDQCKNGGWATITNPVFKNQGECVSYVVNGG